jgi:hypothetical protein
MRLFAAPSAAPVEPPAAGGRLLPCPAVGGRATIPGVELARVGQFDCSTGPIVLTADDLSDILAAFEAQVSRQPVLKLGHIDPMNDGAPSVGWISNLTLTEGGQCLVGDLCGVPQWLADNMATAYPSRSVELTLDYTDADGQVWPMVLDGLALLGATTPAMGSLAAIRELVTASRPTTATRVAAARARRRRRATHQ